MVYDKKSFLAGLAVGVQLKGWMHPVKGAVEEPWVKFENGVLTIYRAYSATQEDDVLNLSGTASESWAELVDGILTIYQANAATQDGDNLEVT